MSQVVVNLDDFWLDIIAFIDLYGVTQFLQFEGVARARPSSLVWGEGAYMNKDAGAGNLLVILADILDNYPEVERTWEWTRLVADDGSLSAAEADTAMKLVVGGLCMFAAANGAGNLMSLSPAASARRLKAMGYNPNAIGRVYRCPDDARRYRVLSMPCDVSVKRSLVEQSLYERATGRLEPAA